MIGEILYMLIMSTLALSFCTLLVVGTYSLVRHILKKWD